MGRTAADFGAVSTEGLIMRAKRKGETVKEGIEAHPLLRRKTKDQRKAVIDATIAEIEDAWEKIKAGQGSEQLLRVALIALLDPQMAGGQRNARFRF